MQKKIFGLSLAAGLLAVTSAVAAPTGVERFNAFVGVAGAAPPDSPSDIAGASLTLVDFGAGGTVGSGFLLDAASYAGNGMTFNRLEDTALIYTAAWPGFTTGNVTFCFAVKFTAALANNSFTQITHHLSATGAGTGTPYLITQVGRNSAGVEGFRVVLPTGAGPAFGAIAPITEVAAGASFNTIIGQYTAPTGAATTDASLSLWLNTTNPADPADATIGTFGAFEAGNDAFDSFGYAALWFFASANGPDITSVDEFGVWNNNTPTELANAMAWMAAPAGVNEWSTLD